MLDSSLRVGKDESTTFVDISRVDESAVTLLKTRIIPVLISQDFAISDIVGDIIELIARDDYDKNWENLLPDLCKALEADDPIVTLKVFKTAQPIFKKIRFMYRSDKLYS